MQSTHQKTGRSQKIERKSAHFLDTTHNPKHTRLPRKGPTKSSYPEMYTSTKTSAARSAPLISYQTNPKTKIQTTKQKTTKRHRRRTKQTPRYQTRNQQPKKHKTPIPQQNRPTNTTKKTQPKEDQTQRNGRTSQNGTTTNKNQNQPGNYKTRPSQQIQQMQTSPRHPKITKKQPAEPTPRHGKRR